MTDADTAAQLARASGLAQAGRFAEAMAIYRKVLRRSPDHPEAMHFLGTCMVRSGEALEGLPLVERSVRLAPRQAMFRQNYGLILAETGDLAGAERELREAIAVGPAIAAAHNYLGMVRQRQGRFDEALSAYRTAIELQPHNPETANNLGYCLFERGDVDGAIEWYRRSLAVEPRNAMGHNNLGNALRAKGDLTAAIDCYRRAIEHEPRFGRAYHNLGLTLRDLGDLEAAYGALRQAVRLEPGFRPAWQEFAGLLATSRFQAWDAALAEDFVQMLSQPDIEAGPAAEAVASLLVLDPQFGPVFRILPASPLQPERWFSGGRLAAITRPLFLGLIENAIIADRDFEAFLIRVRANALKAWQGDALRESPNLLALLCAFASQCFLNEYVWPESPEEATDVARLAQKAHDGGAKPLELALLAAYRSLAGIDGTVKPAAGDSFERMWRRQIVEPAEETRLRAEIAVLTPVEDSTSRAVQRQYEENPYPRWHGAPSSAARFPLRLMLRTLFPHLDPAGLAVPEPPAILVAGCGTGRHAAITASLHPNSRVLSIDISRTSLAYAMRRCRELGLENLRFAQADILGLGSLDERFDLIECAGVLHHLRDPLAGWRVLLSLLNEGGVMKIGLYSALARRSVAAARELLAERGFAPDLAGIRAARQFIFSLPPGHLARQLVHAPDFFSTSGIRDLVFHVEEHRFTMRDLAEAISQLGVEFLGFEHTDATVAKTYREQFADDPTACSFTNWSDFEQSHPDTFSEMYQFWIRKRG